MSPQRRYTLKFQAERVALIRRLGGKCAECGKKRALEVDHPKGRDYVLRQLSQAQRVRRYLDEERRGVKLRALCKKCNSAAWDV